MAKQKENAVVASQEQLADGIYSRRNLQHVDSDAGSRHGKAGAVHFHVYDRWKQVTATPDQHL